MSDEPVPDLGDIGIPSVAGAGALAIYMVVGPSLRAIGNAFGDWTDYRVRNVLRIGEKAGVRLEGKSETVLKPLHPRLARDLIENASWIDNDLQQDYYAALLAAAAQTPKSEEIAYYSRILSNLSPAQTALHYAVYRAYADTAVPGSEDTLTFNRPSDRKRAAVHAHIRAFERVTTNTLTWAAAGLQHEGLIGQVGWSNAEERTYCASPTTAGALLYWLTFDYPDPLDSIRWPDDSVSRKAPTWRGVPVPSAHTLSGAFIAPARAMSSPSDSDADS